MELTVGRRAEVTITAQALAGALAPGQTSVGTSVRLEHNAASPAGMRVTGTAELTGVDGRGYYRR